MSARSRALIPLSAEQQAAMQAVAVTEQRRRQGRTLSAWPYASAFFRCLNGSRRISLTDLRFFAPALTKEEFHGNRLLWLAAVDKLIESFGEVCVLPLPSDAGHRLFPSVPFREGERRRQKTTLTEQKYSRQSGSSCQKNRSNDDSDGKRPHHPQKIVSRSCSSTTPDQRDNQLPTVAGV